MEDTLLIDAIERMLQGEMSESEKIYFDELRKNNPELDQKVVEHIFFSQQLNEFGKHKRFKHQLQEVQNNLAEQGVISSKQNSLKGKVVYLWNRYKRTMAVAASMAGVVSLFVAILVSAVSNNKQGNITQLVKTLNDQETKTRQIESKLNILAANTAPPVRARIESKFRATGFLIDSKNNYIVTNAHVVSQATHQLIVENNKGDQFNAKAVYINKQNDLAIIKIDDSSFASLGALPYRIKKSNAELGEHVFMLGYPKQEIVYGEGFISAKNGYQMDTIYCQLSTPAIEGNSGSPVVTHDGDLVGVITSTETNSQGVVYAIKASYLFTAIDEIEKLEGHQNIKVNDNPTLKGLKRTTQIKKMQDFVFMIKGN